MIVILGLLTSTAPSAGRNIEHDLEVELFPAENKLVGRDHMKVSTDDNESLRFRLSENAEQISVEVNAGIRKFKQINGWLHVPLAASERNTSLQVTVRYSAVFDDPVPIRPVNTDNPGFGVSASISDRGSLLLSGAGWYPELSNARAEYRIRVIAPQGIIAVTAGRSTGRTTANGKTVSGWHVDYPVEGLSISAAPYHVQEKIVGNVTVATYFLESDPRLSGAYLEATANYLEFYAGLFGPYAFHKFAVVENFFPTGYGFPSYTLLGSRVLRLPFIIKTSLGHEIAHCWWGNGVHADYNNGNWSEALTTYVADYLYKEKQSALAARSHRRQILRNYATLVLPQNDFALKQFINRRDPATQTVGYDKGAMVFHMLRKSLGEEAFWGALRDVYRERLFQPTSWADLQQAFEARANSSLQEFFDQWVHRTGAAQFFLDDVQAEKLDGRWRIGGRIVQEKPYYSFTVRLELEDRTSKQFKGLEVKAVQETRFEMNSDSAPVRLTVDPDDDIMRRLYEAEIPPSINSLKSSPSVLFLMADNTTTELKKTAGLLALSLGLKRYEFATGNSVSPAQLQESDLVIMGRPEQKSLLRRLPSQIEMDSSSFTFNDKVYDQISDVFFGVFAHPTADNRVAALFWPLSDKYAEATARKITHYGRYSYLVFQNGKNQEKGVWPPDSSPLVYEWDQASQE
ncbi:MAG: M1 family peptidase [Deltaproteobacteria bacterium]|nr:M1 family peptidase [Deltaproteobacteria bacterium]